MSSIQVAEYEALVLAKSNAEKQEYGGRLVAFVGGIPGPLGRDGGVDGWFSPSSPAQTIYFQVKLSKHSVSLDTIKNLRQTCTDNNSARAILISVRRLSSEAEKYLEEHACSFSLCHLTLADILTSRHYGILDQAGFPEAQFLAQKLTGALSEKTAGAD